MYAVTLLFTKQEQSKPVINSQLSLNIIEANSAEEAFGIAFNLQQPRFPEHQLFLKVVRQVKEVADNQSQLNNPLP